MALNSSSISSMALSSSSIGSPADEVRPFTVQEGKQLSGLGINQLYAAVGRGEIPSIRVGRRILLPRKAFLAWLNGD